MKDGLPEINFDATPQESLDEIKNLELRNWRKLLEDEKLWEEEIIRAIFRNGNTVYLLLEFFKNQTTLPYSKLAALLAKRVRKYYTK